MRRRLLLANSHAESGGGEGDFPLEFPINLVEGDNGQIGADLYNYIYERKDSNGEYLFADNEIVYVEGYRATGGYWVENGGDTSFVTFIRYILDSPYYYMSLSLYPVGRLIVALD